MNSRPPKGESLVAILFRHIREPMAMLLVAAGAFSGLGLGEQKNALAILAIVVLNVFIGLLQEGRAARAMEALRILATPVAFVVRDGRGSVHPGPRARPRRRRDAHGRTGSSPPHRG